MSAERTKLSRRCISFPGKLVTAVILLVTVTGAHAAVEQEAQFVFNTFSFLIWGALVMWMCAGFTMLEAGSVRTKNSSVICLKNIGLYSIAGLMYYLVGYNLMYTDVSGWIRFLDLYLRAVGGGACPVVR